MLTQHRCELLADVMKRCLDEERLLLQSVSCDVSTSVCLKV